MYLSQVSDAKEVIRVSYCDVTDNTHVLLLKKLGDPAEFRSAFRVVTPTVFYKFLERMKIKVSGEKHFYVLITQKQR